jgi:hypothetical protein
MCLKNIMTKKKKKGRLQRSWIVSLVIDAFRRKQPDEKENYLLYFHLFLWNSSSRCANNNNKDIIHLISHASTVLTVKVKK